MKQVLMTLAAAASILSAPSAFAQKCSIHGCSDTQPGMRYDGRYRSDDLFGDRSRYDDRDDLTYRSNFGWDGRDADRWMDGLQTRYRVSDRSVSDRTDRYVGDRYREDDPYRDQRWQDDRYRDDRRRDDRYRDTRSRGSLYHNVGLSRDMEDCRCDGGRCECPSGAVYLRGSTSSGGRLPAGRDLRDPFRRPNQDRSQDWQLTSQPAVRTVQWEQDFRRGLQQARDQRRPMLVRVTADWCGYCRQMKDQTFRHEGVIRDINQTFVAIELDADSNRELIEKMGVKSLPATLVISPDLRIVDRELGFRSPNQLAPVLQRHHQQAGLDANLSIVNR